MILVISGPTGAGKGTIINAILEKHPDFIVPDSYTTRPPRAEEGTRKQYRFVTKNEFMARVKTGEILEWVSEYGFLYGTATDSVSQAMKNNQNLIVEVDPRGALFFKKQYSEAIAVFIKPESLDIVRHRLEKDPHRRGMTKEELAKRVRTAAQEMKYMDQFDHVVTNPDGHPEQAIEQIEQMIIQERKKESTDRVVP